MKVSQVIIGGLMLLIVLLMLFGLFMATALFFMEHDTQTVKTECYDKYGHEVNDLVCDKKVLCNYKWEILNNDDCKGYALNEVKRNE